jgi:hypothetical protein
MSIDRDALVAYLRQRAEFGEKEVFLAGFDRLEILDLLRGRGGQSMQATGAPAVSAAAPTVETPATTATAAASTAPKVRERLALDPARALNVLREDAIACTRCGLYRSGYAGRDRGRSLKLARPRLSDPGDGFGGTT